MERVFSSITLLIFVFFPCLTIFFATITEALETKSDEKTEARKMYDDVYNAGINISNEMRHNEQKWLKIKSLTPIVRLG